MDRAGTSIKIESETYQIWDKDKDRKTLDRERKRGYKKTHS